MKMTETRKNEMRNKAINTVARLSSIMNSKPTTTTTTTANASARKKTPVVLSAKMKNKE